MDALRIAGVEVAPGERTTIRIPVTRPYGQAEAFLLTRVLRGRKPGPRLFVSAALHGDEINGVEIVRRLLRSTALRRLRGALIALPVVNIYGFWTQSRYLPDRRDLNRSFPGSPKGSFTSRLAHLFMKEVVENSTHGIDLHTGSLHRTNLPQVRACLEDAETEKLARAFGAPVMLNANLRDGSLRQAVLERNIPMLLYEGGEALRFDEIAIRAGVSGILSVMRAIGMLPTPEGRRAPAEPFLARSSTWVRAPDSGVLVGCERLGVRVKKDQPIGLISNPLGENEVEVRSPVAGIVIGRTNLPLVNEGDALFHVASFERPSSVAAHVEAFRAGLDPSDDDLAGTPF